MSSNSDEKAVYTSEKGVADPESPRYEEGEGEVVGEVVDFGEKKDLKYAISPTTMIRDCEPMVASADTHLPRQGLSQRHIQMISLAGAIGTVCRVLTQIATASAKTTSWLGPITDC